MKKILIVPIILICLCTLTFNVSAEDDDNFYSDELIIKYSERLFDSLDSDTKNLLSMAGLDKLNSSSIFDLSAKDIFSLLRKSISYEFSEYKSEFLTIIGVLIILIIVKSCSWDNSGELIDDVFTAILFIYLSSLIIDITSMITYSLTLISDFLKVLIPVIAALLTFSGNITFSSLYSSMMVGLGGVISVLSENFILPFTGIYFGLMTAMNINDSSAAAKISKAVNSAATTILGIVTTVFTLLLSAKSVISSNVDNLAFRSGKYLISSLIPVVGGAVGSALGSVVGAVGLVKSTLGVFAVIAIIFINLPVFINVLFCRIYLWGLNLICSSFDEKRASVVIENFSNCIKLLSLLCFFELIIVIISTGIAVSLKGAVS